MRALAPESPFDVTRRGYTVGTAILDVVLSASAGPTAVVLG
jgi:arginase